MRLRFSDGAEGVIDLGSQLYGEIFEPLKDFQEFRKFYIHPEFKTIVWPNGADFSVEFLRQNLKTAA